MKPIVALPVVTAIGLIVHACSVQRDMTANQAATAKEEVTVARSGFEPAEPAPVETVSLDPPKTIAPGVALPPATAQYRYIGEWAATTDLCKGGAWRFESRKLSTAGETGCSFDTVAATPTGYELQGMCKAEGKETADTLRLHFDDAARTMRVTAKSLGPATLIYCGD